VAKDYPFARNQRFPSFWVNAIQEWLSSMPGSLHLVQVDGTTVGVDPDPSLGRVGLPIQGRWRYRDTSVTRSVSGAAGTKSVWAVALDTDVDDTPDPATDHTDYSFDLRVTTGADPSGAGVEVFQKIGEVTWDGSAITQVRQTLSPISREMLALLPGGTYSITNATADRSVNHNSYSLNELGNLVYAMAKDLGFVT
jgi:hypothetical protein